MIGKNKTAEPAPVQEKINTLIGEGAIFNGDMTIQNTIRIDGVINGNCSCTGTLILGEKGKITGNITAQNVFISGEVKGDIISDGKLEVLSSGRVIGDITAKKLIVDEDAYFDGRCTMSSEAGRKGLGQTGENQKNAN